MSIATEKQINFIRDLLNKHLNRYRVQREYELNRVDEAVEKYGVSAMYDKNRTYKMWNETAHYAYFWQLVFNNLDIEQWTKEQASELINGLKSRTTAMAWMFDIPQLNDLLKEESWMPEAVREFQQFWLQNIKSVESGQDLIDAFESRNTEYKSVKQYRKEIAQVINPRHSRFDSLFDLPEGKRDVGMSLLGKAFAVYERQIQEIEAIYDEFGKSSMDGFAPGFDDWYETARISNQSGEHLNRVINDYYPPDTQVSLEIAMTPAEIEAEFDLSDGTVRQYLTRHAETLKRAGEARKADGRTWLILRSAAEHIWSNH